MSNLQRCERHFLARWVLTACLACEGYMREQLGVPKDEVTPLCLSAYTNYGTTMAGLVVSMALSPHKPQATSGLLHLLDPVCRLVVIRLM